MPARPGADAQRVEFIDVAGDPISWYCPVCGRELGAELGRPLSLMGRPSGPCPCGNEKLAWEPWNGEIIDGYLVPYGGDRDRPWRN